MFSIASPIIIIDHKRGFRAQHLYYELKWVRHKEREKDKKRKKWQNGQNRPVVSDQSWQFDKHNWVQVSGWHLAGSRKCCNFRFCKNSRILLQSRYAATVSSVSCWELFDKGWFLKLFFLQNSADLETHVTQLLPWFILWRWSGALLYWASKRHRER